LILHYSLIDNKVILFNIYGHMVDVEYVFINFNFKNYF